MYNYLNQQKKKIETVLEPSAGDGRFIELFEQSDKVEAITGVELYEEKISDIRSKITSNKVKVVCSDFIKFAVDCNTCFDLIVGNPPYINMKNMEKKFLEDSRSLCKEMGLPESLMQNAWVAFVLASAKLISDNGTIFFVLPKEFLQVQYAEKLRSFLETTYNTIHIISFSERMFPEIEQEACLVYLTNETKGLPYILYRQYEDLDSEKPVFDSRIERNKPLKKWSNAILSDNEIDLLNSTLRHYTSISDLADSAPGIVTGSNSKFILTKDEVCMYKCKHYVKAIISKGMMVKKQFEINSKLINQLATEGKKVFLLDLTGCDDKEFPAALKKYLAEVAVTKRNGIQIQNSYKCSRRKPWYAVPIVKYGEVVFFKRYDMCPRISTNPESILTTDIAYNLRLHAGIDGESLAFCFYNTLTLAQCEFVGRYYAGGVSELTPNEFREIVVPYRKIDQVDIKIIKRMFSENYKLEHIIDFVNSRTIGIDISPEIINKLNIIRKKLIGRRKESSDKSKV